jgi:hypothetical protein
MKALSIQQPYADLIAKGIKTIECRDWKTSYRGRILICSTKKTFEDYLVGHAICIATLVDIVEMSSKHYKDAGISKLFTYAWQLINPQKIKPFPVKGQLGLFEFPINLNEAVILPAEFDSILV